MTEQDGEQDSEAIDCEIATNEFHNYQEKIRF